MDSKAVAVTFTFAFLSISTAAALILRGPLGRGIGEWLAGRKRVDEREMQDLRGEVDELRHQLADVQERLDFAERLLAREGEAQRLGPGRS
jgi:hypothetical protein